VHKWLFTSLRWKFWHRHSILWPWRLPTYWPGTTHTHHPYHPSMFFSHVARADPSVDHSRIRGACVAPLPSNWSRRSGRPRHTWLRTVESDLAPLNIGLATACRRAQNRQVWSTLVETAASIAGQATRWWWCGWWWWWRWRCKTVVTCAIIACNYFRIWAGLSLSISGWLCDVVSEMSSDEDLLLLSAGASAATISLVAFSV